ncbi:DUF29 domain-containing protein [Sphaerospermopsis aphanizomenoides BCCUSP55]|uniref:DUF29 domain-containing protein n=1 Tax=Sphaerospermopsis aphanizomenoides TaxID=459663 RepID=UPI000A9E0A56|nr:DUF29 domain-containing protein [Sphaerospermopsis aphanizomenoides]MBK1989645.1 DUF29 domain-containing protein [Sphaerospermopsis aphanizomenoides BCCUSP55]
MTSKLYETDFYAWTLEQAKLLKQGQLNQLDIVNLIEEIESLGKREKQELRNRLGILIGHLLKWQYQSDKRSNSWKATIREQRRRIKEHLEENPSLKSYLSAAIVLAYQDGVDLAIQETNLPDTTFPIENPYSINQIIDPDFLVNEEEQ